MHGLCLSRALAAAAAAAGAKHWCLSALRSRSTASLSSSTPRAPTLNSTKLTASRSARGASRPLVAAAMPYSTTYNTDVDGGGGGGGGDDGGGSGGCARVRAGDNGLPIVYHPAFRLGLPIVYHPCQSCTKPVMPRVCLRDAADSSALGRDATLAMPTTPPQQACDARGPPVSDAHLPQHIRAPDPRGRRCARQGLTPSPLSLLTCLPSQLLGFAPESTESITLVYHSTSTRGFVCPRNHDSSYVVVSHPRTLIPRRCAS